MRAVLWLAKHWPWLAVAGLGLYAGLAVVAPVLRWAGLVELAAPIYWFYIATGHPPDETRYELLGEPWGYGQRDNAIFVAALLVTLWYAAFRPVWPRMPVRLLLLLSVPMLVDALTQVPGWRESDAFWRTLTGGLFGAAAAYFAVTLLAAAFAELRATVERDLARSTGQTGRPDP